MEDLLGPSCLFSEDDKSQPRNYCIFMPDEDDELTRSSVGGAGKSADGTPMPSDVEPDNPNETPAAPGEAEELPAAIETKSNRSRGSSKKESKPIDEIDGSPEGAEATPVPEATPAVEPTAEEEPKKESL